ncbi:hypothetical protein BE04_32765 [Sorangium cellulosum]|uniref:Uncharacterized protein n=2 Tax=Sorangium cellulosum TaxID=56 RepID=A0A150Q1I0_SORCE|nr:hypothetical protein BE04_32765 [Sorangium cellulosum]
MSTDPASFDEENPHERNMIMKTILRLASASMFGLLSAACIADPTWDPEGEPIDEVEEIEEAGEALVCSSIGSTVVTHSCNHTTAGPFGAVTASASQSFTNASPNVNETHKWWTVTLPGSGSSFQGTVKFRYGFTDDYVIFLKDPDVSVTVLDSVGDAVTKTYDIAVSGCSNITRAIGVTLTANATYRFTLSDTTATQELLIERQNGCNAID